MRNIEIRKPDLWMVFNRVLVLGVLPNLFFAILGSVFFLQRGWFNIDYLGLCAVSAFIPSIVTAISFSALFLLDVLLAVAPGFYFEPTGFLTNALEITKIISPYTILFSGSFLVFSTIYSGIVFRFFLGKVSFFLSIIIFLSSFSLVAGFVSVDRGLVLPDFSSRYNVATSTAKIMLDGLRETTDQPDSFKRVPAATDELFEMISQGRPLPARLILIVVESWGIPQDEVLRQRIRDIFRDPSIALKYDTTWGEVPFFASTVPGEMRELCRVETFRKVPQLEKIDVDACLPNLLGSAGYKTIAMHNFKGSFFSRYSWYPKLGFGQVLFQDEMHELDSELGLCGHTFRGFCDADMPELIDKHLLGKSDKSFVYWVTLNSHLPVSEPNHPSEMTWCGEIPSLEGKTTVCKVQTWVQSTMSAIADFAAAQEAGEVGIIVVGDHAPPILHLDSRSAFDGAKVPSLILWPKTRE